MKKIGIATFHFADNYGAVLQCFALQKVINNFPTCEAEIINYIPVGYQYPKRWKSIYEQNQFREKRKKFENFLIKYCSLNTKKEDYILGLDYDICCVGSDQVWNTSGLMTEYFLPNINKSVRKISYAASVGVSVDSPRFLKLWFEKYVKEFDFISVREYEHVETISNLCKKSCSCVVDPTLLLSKEDYELLIPNSSKKEPFVFFYWLTHDNDLMRGVELTNTIARKYNLEIIHSIYDAPQNMFANKSECMFYDSIEEFLWLIKNADFVVTNSYHGTIFSMIFQRPFYTFIVESMRSRIDTLLVNIDLKNHIVDSYIGVEQIKKQVINLDSQKKFVEKRKESLCYLKRAIGVDYE